MKIEIYTCAVMLCFLSSAVFAENRSAFAAVNGDLTVLNSKNNGTAIASIGSIHKGKGSTNTVINGNIFVENKASRGVAALYVGSLDSNKRANIKVSVNSNIRVENNRRGKETLVNIGSVLN